MAYKNLQYSVYFRVVGKKIYSVCNECPFLPKNSTYCVLGYHSRLFVGEHRNFVGAPDCELVYVSWRLNDEPKTGELG